MCGSFWPPLWLDQVLRQRISSISLGQRARVQKLHRREYPAIFRRELSPSSLIVREGKRDQAKRSPDLRRPPDNRSRPLYQRSPWILYPWTRPRRDSSKSPSQRTFPLSRRIAVWACVSTSNRKPASTVAFLVRVPLWRMAWRIKRSSMSILVRICYAYPMCKYLTIMCIEQVRA